MSTKDSISIRYQATDTVYIADSFVGRITFIRICTVESTSSFCYIFKNTAIGDEKMGNIFENRESWQSRRSGLLRQIQWLQEYRGEYRKARERGKSMRCLKYFVKIGAVMQRADQ